MLRVLHVVFHMGCGGIETSLMKLHRKIDKNTVQFDFYCYDDKEQYYEKEIKELGGIVYHSKHIHEMGIFTAYRVFSKFLAQHPEYKIIHIHTWYATIQLLAAKKNRRIGIVHSRNTNPPKLSLEDIAQKIFAYPQRYLADYFFAVSPQAGIDMFGKNVKVNFFHNGIDIHQYTFDPALRKSIRESRGINFENRLVLGHVGNFRPQKNHKFLIEVFKHLRTKIPDAKLWLLGSGPLEDNVRSQVHSYELDDAVDFIGLANHVNEYLMGMDVLAFPSFYEGLSGALMEAQCSGLPCIVSYGNQSEGIVSDRVRRLSINSPNDVERWADAIIEANTKRDNREKYARIVAEAGFDIEDTARELQDFYLSLVNP